MTKKTAFKPGSDNHMKPAELVKPLERSQITKTVIISLALHAVAILAFSIGNIALCIKHGTLSPVAATEAEAKEKKDEEKEEKDAKRAEARAKREAERKTHQDEKKPEKASPDKPPETSADKPDEKPKSKVERTLQEKSSERPKASTMSLDELDDGL